MTQYILGVSKIAKDKNIETQMSSDILNRITQTNQSKEKQPKVKGLFRFKKAA
jgi:hypothetical protein